MNFNRSAVVIFTAFIIALNSVGFAAAPAHGGAERYAPEIAPYVEFIKKCETKPVDYVMGLFDKYEVVILCERYHAEMTQYDLIYDIVSDPRFIDKVGSIFTEVGSAAIDAKVHDYLFAARSNDAAVRAGALDIYRNLSWMPYWDKTNLFEFLQRLRRLNETLPASKKIELHPCDMAVDWNGMTPEKYRKFRKTLARRDRAMADAAIEKIRALSDTGAPRKKALIIMNYRHAFGDAFTLALGGKQDNTARYIFEAFPGKVANVMLNSLTPLVGSTDQYTSDAPHQLGKWDAAFEVTGNRAVGFDFAGSPFGADFFDYFSFMPHFCNYSHVFTGFVFYRPLREHRQKFGVPGFLDDGFDAALAARLISCGDTPDDARRKVRSLKRAGVRIFSYDKLETHEKAIKKWLK